MAILFELFICFAKIGLFTFGGGYAMISIIEDECVVKKKWITHEEMLNVTVIAESTPGPVAINCATFVGYKRAGFLGAVFSTIGVIVPSFTIIYLISVFLENFLEIELVARAFAGIRIAVGILILYVSVNMIKKMKRTAFSLVVLFCACIAMLSINIFSLQVSTIVLMVIAAVVGLINGVIRNDLH